MARPSPNDGRVSTWNIPASAAVIIYGQIVAITIVALILTAIAGVWLIGEYNSTDGLSGPEIGVIISGVLGLLNQITIWRVSALGTANAVATKEIREQNIRYHEWDGTTERRDS